MLITGLVVILCLSACLPGAMCSVAAAETPAQTIKLSLKQEFRAVHVGKRYAVALKKSTLKTCQTSQDSIVSVSGKTITAKSPGKAMVTITDRENRKYRLSLWVRPITEYNKKTQKVCMVGNSHFRTGGQPGYFKGIAALYGQRVKMLNESIDGYMLEQHLRNARKGKSIAKSLKKADVVVFQEYGIRYNTTLDSILQMKSYCKENARFYYYATDYDIHWSWDSRRKELEENGISIIDSGTLLESMYSIGFSYEDLHYPNDDHPNDINGHVSSMLMYARIFEEKCCDFPTKQYLEYFEFALPGKTRAEKWKQFKKICKAADKLAV